MSAITSDELKKLPYLDTSALDGRTVNLMPLWDGANWRMWLNTPIGLIEGRIVDTIESDYLAKSAAKQADLFIPFIHAMWQQASWTEICPLIVAISDDFHNMGTSVAKLKHFHGFRKRIGDRGSHRFALTELEYLVTLCRTTFDLLQEMIAWIWETKVRLLDETAEAFRSAHPLRKTFSRMVLDENDQPRSALALEEKFGLPRPLAEQYKCVAPFFSELRRIRDRIVHGGSGFGMIYNTERGFCVDPKTPPFDRFDGWRPEHYYNENIASVLPWIADTILKTIDACNSLIGAFGSVVQLPPPIAPGYTVFVRGYHNEALVELLSVHSGGSAWWDDPLLDQRDGQHESASPRSPIHQPMLISPHKSASQL